jgi:hypothetical protein
MLRTVKLASLATLWLVPVLIFVSAFSSDWVSVWRTAGVPSMLPRFADITSIAEGLETQRHGQDPMVVNPADALGRTVNYPRIWLEAFSALRVNTRNIWVVGLSFCALYLLCMSVLIARAGHPEDAVVLLLVGLSVSPLLAMERGNNDLFVFALIFLGCAATDKFVKSLSLAAGSLLKIFPIAAMAIDVVRRPSKQRILPIVSMAVVCLLFALQWHDLNLIRLATPVSRIRSYGFLPLQEEILRFFPQSLVSVVQLPWIVAGAFFLAEILAVHLSWKSGSRLDPEFLNSPKAEMFAIFGGTYAFTYAIGSNWDYRLIFLLPTLPFALEMARMVRFRRWALAYVVLVGIAENALALEMHGGTLLVHLATLAVFLFVLVVLTQQFKLSMAELLQGLKASRKQGTYVEAEASTR